MRDMSLEPEVIKVEAVRTWMSGQLPFSEILVTMLAGLLVGDRGYNIQQSGTTSDIETRD